MFDVSPQKEIQGNDIRRTCVPTALSSRPNPTKSESEGFSNVQTPVWGNPIPLSWLQICYLGVHELFQHVKANATRYCGFYVEKWPSKPAFIKAHQTFTSVLSRATSLWMREFSESHMRALSRLAFPDRWNVVLSEN